MNVQIDSAVLHVSASNAVLQGNKTATGRFSISGDWDEAVFTEQEGTLICGESKSRRVKKGKNYSIWWNPDKERYTVRIIVPPDQRGALLAECDFEECINYIRMKINENRLNRF